MEKGKRTQIMRWKKDNLQIFTFKNVLRQLLFLEIVSVMKIKNKLYANLLVKLTSIKYINLSILMI